MTHEITFGKALCYCPVFKINGLHADINDFGEKSDHDRENAEEYGCGDMQFVSAPPTPEALAKYGIDEVEYNIIANKLVQGLSFGACGWCV